MNEWLDKCKGWFGGAQNAIGKSRIVNARVVWLGTIGVLLLIFGSVFDGQYTRSAILGDEAAKPEQAAPSAQRTAPQGADDTAATEEKLTRLLSRVKGAGHVAVTVTVDGSARKEHAKNVTKETKTVQEKDTSGGVRTTSETKESEQILMSKSGGADQPVVVSETRPEIRGVLIVAEGAGDSNVKADLTRAAETGLGIPCFKITVLQQGK